MEKFIFSGILIATLISMVNHRAPLPQSKAIDAPASIYQLTIGQQIQLARIKKGFSQNYLARISGVALEKLVSIEKQGAMPTVNDLYKLQDILGGGIVVSGDTIARL
ncbi:MAG: putative transcriptional regulator [Granulosicoccus sp.]|jgi:predicted transcriptional regulator